MSLFVLVEILDDDGVEVKPGDEAFDTDTLRHMITNAANGDFLFLRIESEVYAIPMRIAGVVRDPTAPRCATGSLKMVFVEPLTGLNDLEGS